MSAVPSGIGIIGIVVDVDVLFRVFMDLVFLIDRLSISDSQELLLVSVVMS